MSSWPVLSALDAGTQTFPILTSGQIDRLCQSSRIRPAQPGEILFGPGDTAVRFFVVLSGKMEIVQPAFSGERLITTHSPYLGRRRRGYFGPPRTPQLGRTVVCPVLSITEKQWWRMLWLNVLILIRSNSRTQTNTFVKTASKPERHGCICGFAWNAVTLVAAILPRTSTQPSTFMTRSIR
jgi:hypothetical protein